MPDDGRMTRRTFLAATGAAATATAAGPVWANWLPAGADVGALVGAGYTKRYVTCFMCGAGCGLMALERPEKEGKQVLLMPNPTHPQRGYCGRGAAALWMWNHPLRLAKPQKRVGARGEGTFVEVSWDEALDDIGRRLRAAVEAKGERSVVYTSHDVLQLQQIAGYALGTPNLVNHASTCLTPGAVGRRWTYGAPYDHHRRVDPDYEQCRYLMFFGRTVQASMGAAHRIAQARAKGTLKAVYVDPRRPDQALARSEWVPIVPGTDAALILAMIREIVGNGLADRTFLAAQTNAPLLVRDDGMPLTSADLRGDKDGLYAVWDAAAGAPAFVGVRRNERGAVVEAVAPAGLAPALDYEGEVTLASGAKARVRTAWSLLKARVLPYTPEHAAAITGVDAATIRRLAREFATEGGVADDGWYWTRNGNDSDVARALLMLNAVVGNADRRGGLAFSRAAGLSLVTLDAAAKQVRLPNAAFPLEHTQRIDTIPYPESQGTFQVVVDAILSGKPYAISTVICGATTLVHREANAPRLLEAIAKLDLFVVVDIVPQDICDYADYVLPATFFLERGELSDVKWTLDAALHRSEAVLPMPKGIDARDDLWILLEMLRRAYPERALKAGYGPAQATPDGFAKYKEAMEQAMLGNCLKTWSAGEPAVAERVARELGAQGYCVLGAKRYDDIPYKRPLDTPSGRIEVYALRAVLNGALRKAGADPLPDYRPVTAYTLPKAPDEFYVVSGKSMSSTSGHAVFAYTGKALGDRSVWMHPDDGARLGIRTGDAIELEGLDTKAKGTAPVQLTYRVRPGVLFTYAFSGGFRAKAVDRDPRFAFLREGINPNMLSPGKAEPVTGALANNFSARVRRA